MTMMMLMIFIINDVDEHKTEFKNFLQVDDDSVDDIIELINYELFPNDDNVDDDIYEIVIND